MEKDRALPPEDIRSVGDSECRLLILEKDVDLAQLRLCLLRLGCLVELALPFLLELL